MFLIAAAVLLGGFLVRLYREPRRLSNGVYLILVLLFLGLWLLWGADLHTKDRVIGGILLAAPLLAIVLAIFLTANGVIMLRREGHRPANALSLSAGVTILALLGGVTAVGIVVLSDNSDHSGRWWLVVIAGTVVLLASYAGFVFMVFLVYSVIYARLPQRSGHAALVVLGCGVRDGLVRPLLAARLDRAAALYWRETAARVRPVVVTSGGQGPDEPVPEAQVMADYLRRQGIPDEALLEEDRSTSTRQNLELSTALLAERGIAGRLLVVTSNYHVLRVAILTRRLRLPADVRGAKTAWYYLPNAFLREFVAILAQYPVLNAVAAVALGSVFPLLALSL